MDDDQVAWGPIKPLGSSRRHGNDVFDSHPESTWQIHSGLDAERHSWLQRERVVRHDVGFLVHLEADPVTCAMDEEVAVSSCRDRTTRDSVDALCLNPRSYCPNTGILSLLNDRVDMLELIAGATNIDG